MSEDEQAEVKTNFVRFHSACSVALARVAATTAAVLMSTLVQAAGGMRFHDAAS